MTLTLKMFVAGVAASVFFAAILATFLGNQRLAYASVVPPGLGSQIVCLVFTNLNIFGAPLPHLDGGDCPSSPPAESGSLKVVKTVSGGTASPADFQIHVASGSSDISGSPQAGSSSGTSYIGISPGTYTVSESGGPENYTASFSGDCDASGIAGVASGGAATCTITNTFHAPPPPPTAENTSALCSDGIDNDGDEK